MIMGLHPEAAGEIKVALGKYLAPIADGPAKAGGVKLGEGVAAAILQARGTDAATAREAYRPKTRPGVWVQTPAAVASAWPNMRPFALGSPSQFRPGPPPALDSKEWAGDYNDINA